VRFLLIDRITSLTPGEAATAIKRVALSEDFFDDHFPLKPIVPGVLVVEGLAQLSGALLRETVNREGATGVKALLDSVAVHRFGKAADVANAVSFLASESSGFITGQVLRVDGGMLL